MARRYWPGEDPIGKRLKGQDPRGPKGGKNDDWVTVVGLVRDIRAAGRERQPISQIYEYQKQSQELTPMLVIRTPGNPAQLASAARATLSGIDRSIPGRQTRPSVGSLLWGRQKCGDQRISTIPRGGTGRPATPSIVVDRILPACPSHSRAWPAPGMHILIVSQPDRELEPR
jgi:hypothetical protein